MSPRKSSKISKRIPALPASGTMTSPTASARRPFRGLPRIALPLVVLLCCLALPKVVMAQETRFGRTLELNSIHLFHFLQNRSTNNNGNQNNTNATTPAPTPASNHTNATTPAPTPAGNHTNTTTPAPTPANNSTPAPTTAHPTPVTPPTHPPTKMPTQAPNKTESGFSFFRMIGKLMAWCICMLLGVILYGFCLQHKYQIAYYLRHFGHCLSSVNAWLIEKIRPSHGMHRGYAQMYAQERNDAQSMTLFDAPNGDLNLFETGGGGGDPLMDGNNGFVMGQHSNMNFQPMG